jgi:hypothetical protein
VRAPARSVARGRLVSGRCAHAREPRVALTESGWGAVTWRQDERIYAAVVNRRWIGAARRLVAEPVAPCAPAVVATGDRVA